MHVQEGHFPIERYPHADYISSSSTSVWESHVSSDAFAEKGYVTRADATYSASAYRPASVIVIS
jgi:hypothetical protein